MLSVYSVDRLTTCLLWARSVCLITVTNVECAIVYAFDPSLDFLDTNMWL